MLRLLQRRSVAAVDQVGDAAHLPVDVAEPGIGAAENASSPVAEATHPKPDRPPTVFELLGRKPYPLLAWGIKPDHLAWPERREPEPRVSVGGVLLTTEEAEARARPVGVGVGGGAREGDGRVARVARRPVRYCRRALSLDS